MLNNFILSLFVYSLTLFSDSLTNVDITDYDNTVFIVVGNLYCSDCLKELSKNQTIWQHKFSTILVTTSERNRKTVLINSKSFRKQFEFDDIIFLEQNRRDLVKSILFEGNNISYTPALLIRKNGISKFYDHKELFKNDTTNLKYILENIFNNE